MSTSPRTTTITVRAIERVDTEAVASLVFPGHGAAGKHGIRVQADLSDGRSVDLSRLDGETEWTVDAMFAANGCPRFMNGFGARYLLTQALAAEFAAQVDAQVEAMV